MNLRPLGYEASGISLRCPGPSPFRALTSADAHSVVARGLGCLLRLGLFRCVPFTDRFTGRLADLRITVACATVPAVHQAAVSLLRGFA